jgi:hypothetical protein
VEEFSEANSLDGVPSALSKSTPIAQAFWSHGKTTVFSRLSRFGMTCKPLTGSHGEELLTSFRAGFPVSISPSPEREQDSTASKADSGVNSPESLAKYDRATHSWRTAQLSLFEEGCELLEILPRWGMTVAGELYPLPTPALRTEGSGSGLWPTPTARDWKDGTAESCANVPENCLLGRAVHWRTSDAYPREGPQAPEKRKAGGHSVSLQDQIGGSLNPTFVEWLMGFPLGWINYEPLEMPKFLEWRRAHGGSLATTCE